MAGSHSRFRFVHCISMMPICCSITSLRCFIGLRCDRYGNQFDCSELIVTFKKAVWDDLSFLTWCVTLLDADVRRWVDSHLQHYSGTRWCLNYVQMVWSVKTLPTPFHHPWRELLMQGRMDPSFRDFYTKFWHNIWITQEKLWLIRLGNIFPIFYCPLSPCEL